MANIEDLLNRLKSGTLMVTGKVGNATRSAASKVELKTREAKIRYAMHEVESRMRSNFTAIGESVYRSYKADEELDDFTELMGRLDALNDEMESLKRELYTECNLSMCPDCNASVRKGDSFCPKCGVKINNE